MLGDQSLNGLEATGHSEPPAPAPAPLEEALHFFVGALPPGPFEYRHQLEPVLPIAILQQIHALQRHRALVFDDEASGAPPRSYPRGELLGVCDRRRQGDNGDLPWQVDDDLFPYLATCQILQVVDLVENHDAEIIERSRVGIDHVAQHLGRHHHDRRITIDDVISGEETDTPLAIPRAEVAKLLV